MNLLEILLKGTCQITYYEPFRILKGSSRRLVIQASCISWTGNFFFTLIYHQVNKSVLFNFQSSSVSKLQKLCSRLLYFFFHVQVVYFEYHWGIFENRKLGINLCLFYCMHFAQCIKVLHFLICIIKLNISVSKPDVDWVICNTWSINFAFTAIV